MNEDRIIVIDKGDYPVKKLEDIEKPESTLRMGRRLMNMCGLFWWISSGTLLGFYRDKDFIPYDTDIDVGVKVMAGQDVDWYYKTVKAVFEKYMRPIRTILEMETGRPMQMAYIDKNDCIFDIYYYYEGIEEGKLVNYNESSTMKKDAFIFNRLKLLETKYGEYPAPMNIEAYMVMRYGPYWHIPSKGKGMFDGNYGGEDETT